MGSNDDPVKVAKSLLRSRLENLCVETATECYHTFARQSGMSPPWVPPAFLLPKGRELLGKYVTQWRENSLEVITEGFKSIVALMPQRNTPGYKAKGPDLESGRRGVPMESQEQKRLSQISAMVRQGGFFSAI